MHLYKKMRHYITFFLFILSSFSWAKSLDGVIKDDQNFPLIGAHVKINSLHLHTVSGMDGSFHFPEIDTQTILLEVSFMGFKNWSQTIHLNQQNSPLIIQLEENATQLNTFNLIAKVNGGSMAGARLKEKKSEQVINITSSEAIALSPDNSVAEVIQRVSGVTLESNPSGTGSSFTIIRGMPKRYNYTLVNGIKIPSSNNKNRFVSLDLFPSDLLERLEVIKSLTPEMEGDAVGGVVNMVMKKAPEKPTFKVNAFVGYHSIYFHNNFHYFDASKTDDKSPFQKYGPDYKASANDFTTENRETYTKEFAPDMYASLSYGKRFFKKKLGLIITGTANKMHTGAKSVRFEPSTTRDGNSLPVLTNMTERFYYNNVTQFGLNALADYYINANHQIQLSGLFLNLNNNQLREQEKSRLWGVNPGDPTPKVMSQRFRQTTNLINNYTLQGDHKITQNQKVKWVVAYSKAQKKRPDHADFVTVNNYSLVQGQESILIAEDGDNQRSWEYNTDKDITGKLDYSFNLQTDKSNFTFKVGGLYRLKNRNSFIVTYRFNPDPAIQAYGYDWKPDDANITEYGTWEKYGDVQFRIRNPEGSTRNELNNNAHQNIAAAYGLVKLNHSQLIEVIGGLRMEHTDQGYELLAPRADQVSSQTSSYVDYLPSISVKYNLSDKSNVRFSYFYSIIRPGYFEIIPYMYRMEDYIEMGNPDLKKIRTHNVDLRYENYFNPTDQLLIGIFYKQINDPIEYVLTDGKDFGINDIVRRPDNFGTATNYGLEVNYIKYHKTLGIKFNYSYTNSSVTTQKSLRSRENPEDDTSPIVTTSIDQTRPLQGQSAHIGNISLLYKGLSDGIKAQLSGSFTGERIRTVSNFYNNDEWEGNFFRLDFSIEKEFKKNLSVYLKTRNLLNSKYQTFIKQPVSQENSEFPYQGNPGDHVLTGSEQVGLEFRLGVKLKL